jgi:hypothetical protein
VGSQSPAAPGRQRIYATLYEASRIRRMYGTAPRSGAACVLAVYGRPIGGRDMGSLASRILGGELLTLQEFAHEVATRLAYEMPAVTVTQPRPELMAVSHAGARPVEFNLQPSYRAYQKDPRSRDQIIKRVVRWIEAGTRPR